MAFELGTMIVILLGLALVPVVLVSGMLVLHMCVRGHFGSGCALGRLSRIIFPHPPTPRNRPGLREALACLYITLAITIAASMFLQLPVSGFRCAHRWLPLRPDAVWARVLPTWLRALGGPVSIKCESFCCVNVPSAMCQR